MKPIDAPQTAKLRFTNGAPEALWINWQSPHALWPQTLKINPGQGADYNIPGGSIPGTRFWPKYGCDSNG